MKKNGFISSALLYGMLALFLVVMMSTLAILGNRKLSMDKLKENALNNIQYGYAQTENIYALYDGLQPPDNDTWMDQSGNGHDATLVNFASNSYTDRHLVFNGTSSYLDTGFKASDLGQTFTISAVLNLQNASNSRGIFGYYSPTDKAGVYAYIKQTADDTVASFCYYNTSSEEVCADVSVNNTLYPLLNQTVQLTIVMQGGQGIDVYLNDAHFVHRADTKNIKFHVDNLIFGNSNIDNTNLFRGNLYNLTIYKSTLSLEDVQKNFQINNEKYQIIG